MAQESKRPPFADHLTSAETIGDVPIRYSLQFTVEANDAGHALLADIDAALKRAQSPAPAWTREAPKERNAWYWTRLHEIDESRVPRFFAGDERWLDGDSSDPADEFEHWPQRLEPPK